MHLTFNIWPLAWLKISTGVGAMNAGRPAQKQKQKQQEIVNDKVEEENMHRYRK